MGAGDWIKMRVNLAEDPAVIVISSTLKLPRDATIGKLYRLWSWADQHTLDGYARVGAEFIDEFSGQEGFSTAMTSVGWLEIRPDGIVFPNFNVHNGKSGKSRALGMDRQKASRLRNAGIVTEPLPAGDKSVTRKEKRRTETSSKALSGKPDESKLRIAKAVELLGFLNEKTGCHYQPVKANIDMIVSRLKEGFGEKAIRQVIANRCLAWQGDPKMDEYLRPKTLFAASNFASYAGQIGKTAPEAA